MTVTELRTNLTHYSNRLQELRDESAKDRDRTSDPVARHGYSREVAAYNLSLSALFAWTNGEFGEDFTEDGAQ